MIEDIREQLDDAVQQLPIAEAIVAAEQLQRAAEGLAAAGQHDISSDALAAQEHSRAAARLLTAGQGLLEAYAQGIAVTPQSSPAVTERQPDGPVVAALERPGHAEIAAALFTEERPTPAQLTELIRRGLTEDDIRAAAVAAGLPVPKMELTLADTDTILPFLDAMADELVRLHPAGLFVFADRDDDLLYDRFTVRHPEADARLLPASTDLWRSPGMRDPALARQFLADYGIDERVVADPEKEVVVADAGFNGRVGLYLNDKIKELYGISLREAGRMPIELVATVPGTHGRQILDVADADIPELPKVTAWLEEDFSGYSEFSSAYRLAISLNLMPRSRDTFENLERCADGSVRAVSRQAGEGAPEYVVKDRRHFQKDVDSNAYNFPDHNASVVNPVAAAIVQYRTIRTARPAQRQ